MDLRLLKLNKRKEHLSNPVFGGAEKVAVLPTKVTLASLKQRVKSRRGDSRRALEKSKSVSSLESGPKISGVCKVLDEFVRTSSLPLFDPCTHEGVWISAKLKRKKAGNEFFVVLKHASLGNGGNTYQIFQKECYRLVDMLTDVDIPAPVGSKNFRVSSIVLQEIEGKSKDSMNEIKIPCGELFIFPSRNEVLQRLVEEAKVVNEAKESNVDNTPYRNLNDFGSSEGLRGTLPTRERTSTSGNFRHSFSLTRSALMKTPLGCETLSTSSRRHSAEPRSNRTIHSLNSFPSARSLKSGNSFMKAKPTLTATSKLTKKLSRPKIFK